MCAGTSPTDGEGIIFDTFDGSQGGLPTPYAAQAVAENNILVGNGAKGIEVFNNSQGAAHAPIYITGNTSWGNLQDPNQHYLGCAEIAVNVASSTQVSGNLVSTASATGCGGNPIYSLSVETGNATDSVANNFAYSQSGNNTFLYASGAFSYGSNAVGQNPLLTNAAAQSAPQCSGHSDVPSCMASMVADFAPQTTAAQGFGYQPPSSTVVSNHLFPQWLCTANVPSGLVTMGCAP
jgi:hypothetical protein